MALSAGTRLGPYEILSTLGAGGMGEVYRARDTRLDRIVAIKILPEGLAADPQFRDRFDREARTISQLEHPHICALYDVGEQDGTSFLVMQYLEGETLQDRLTKGALPFEQALTIATQIASALDKAHRAGIVHRDLKPGNIMLTKAGAAREGSPQAKLLDFGLAKARQPVIAGAGLSMVPTKPNLTAHGAILGTFQYMAPEQLEGSEADARTDIFAFGAVVYEMLTGKKAFEGTSHASLISAIMTSNPPPISTLKSLITPALDRIVQKCLAKDPEDRWQSVHDVRGELVWISETAGQREAAPNHARSRKRFASIAAASLFVAFLTTVMAVRSFSSVPPVPELPLVSFEVSTPPTSDPTSFALSPDGRILAFVANREGQAPQLWLRSLNDTVPRPLAGTEGANYPFWKPDSRSIGFFADRKLKTINIAGGGPEVLADASAPRGGAWSEQDVILFAPTSTAGLVRVPAGGGTVVPVVRAVGGRLGLGPRWPQFLPDGHRFLFYLGLAAGDALAVYVGSLDGIEPRRILTADSAASYVPPGYLLFVRQDSLMALRFDPIGASVSGEPINVARGIGADTALRLPALSAARNGTLAYRGGVSVQRRQLVWMNRAGQKVGTVGDPDNWASGSPELAPDGQRVAVHRTLSDGNLDVWLVDVTRGVATRFTTAPTNEISAIWSPNGTRLAYGSTRDGPYNLFQMAATDVGNGEPLFVTPEEIRPLSWSPDGTKILYQTIGDKTGPDLWLFSLGDKKRWPVVQTGFDEPEGQFSPDGRWLAYVSTESGQSEVYVQPYPGPGEHQRVSTTGGSQVRWRPDGKEIYYVASDYRLTAVRFAIDADSKLPNLGPPEGLFTTRLANGANITGTRAQYAVARDGRFLMNVRVDDERAAPITVVLNWTAGLQANR